MQFFSNTPVVCGVPKLQDWTLTDC